MPSIRIKNGPNKGKVLEIGDEVLSVGRDTTERIQVLDQGVSRQHSEIFRIGEMCFIRDLNSTNGTFVNDSKVQEELLRHGDQILIGSTIMLFEDRSADESSPGVLDPDKGGKEDSPGTTVELHLRKVLDPKDKIKAVGQEIESRNLATTYEIVRLTANEKDLGGLLKAALELAAQALSATNAYAYMLDPATGKLVQQAAVEGEPGEKKVSRTIIKRVLQTGRAAMTSDASADERFSRSDSVVLKKIRSVICAPLMGRDRASGLIYFHSARTGAAFTREDLELATAVAIQLGMAITAFRAADLVRKGLTSLVRALVTAMEAHDPKLEGHAERVASYAAAIAQQMKLPKLDVARIHLAAILHDIGKIAVRTTPGLEKEAEKAQHVALGEKILGKVEALEEIMPGVKYHHERADGSGFPHRIKNADTPVMARIIIVANVFDNECTHGGVGGQGLPVKDVLIDIGKRGGKEFDDDVVKALLVCHRNGTLYQPANLFPEA